MAVDYNDKRFAKVEADKKTAINNANKTYDTMVNQTDAKYNELINATKDYATTQQKLQQENTDFEVERVNQQKEQAEKDYTKEQTAAYTDYQKATDQYGVGAEQRSKNGMNNTGYAESSKVNAFTSYQNRYATARETFNRAILNYDNSIKEIKLANNSKLAEISFNALKTQLEYALQGFQYKNELLQTKLNTQIQLDSEYNNRYQQVLSQINTENSLAEQIRQYNTSLAYQKERDKVSDAQWQKQYNLSLANSRGSSGGSSSKLSSKSSKLSSGKSKSYSAKASAGVGAAVGGGIKLTNSSSGNWVSAQQLANGLGLPAGVNLSKVLSDKEYEKKTVNGLAYYRKK